MSFICGSCFEAQPDRTKAKRVVVEERTVIYPPVQKIVKGGLSIVFSPEGRETVKEMLVCPVCAQRPVVPKIIAVVFNDEKEAK